MQYAWELELLLINVPLPSAKTTLLKLFGGLTSIITFDRDSRWKLRSSSIPFLRPKPESKSGSMKMFLCLLQKCVSLTLSKSDQIITSDIFSAKLANSSSVPKDAEILGLFTIKCQIRTHRRWAIGLTQKSCLIWTKFFSCSKFQGSIIFDERTVCFHTWEIPDRAGLSFEQMSIFQELTRIWRKIMKLNKMFVFEFFGNLSWEKFLNYRPVSEQIILSSIDFQTEFVIPVRVHFEQYSKALRLIPILFQIFIL